MSKSDYNTNFVLKSELLPEHYSPVSEPIFTGKGNHSVLQLEAICEQYKEFVHQQRIKEQTILRVGNVEIVDKIPNCREIGHLHMVGNDGPETPFDPNCKFCGANLAEENRIKEEGLDNKQKRL
jgi:hypothetical protein